MITFIFEDDISASENLNLVGNARSFDSQGYIREILALGVSSDTLKHCINNTPGMEAKNLNEVDLTTKNTFVYPITTADIQEVFGFTKILFDEYTIKHDNIPKLNPIFDFIPNSVMEKVKNKEAYIALFSICEGKAWPQRWELIEDLCKKENVPISQILFVAAGNHTKNYQIPISKNIKFIHLNYYALELHHQIARGYTNIIDRIKNVKEKHYICLNSQIKPHRYHMVNSLYNNDLLKYGHVSCESFASHVNNYGMDNIYVMKEELRKKGVDIAKFIEFYNTLPYRLDNWEDFQSHMGMLHSGWRHDSNFYTMSEENVDNQVSTQIDVFYKSAVIDIVNETALKYHPVNFLTEKTFKSIMYKLPFIISGDKGINNELLRHGFKLYDMLFDYSFDEYDGYVNRNNAIINQLKTYCKLPLQDFIKRVEKDDVQEVVEHNFMMLETNNVWLNFSNDLYRTLNG